MAAKTQLAHARGEATAPRTCLSCKIVVANWLVPVALGCSVLALRVSGAPVYEALRCERAAVLGGQYWRLLSPHAVHLGWTHCLMNAGRLALCTAFAAGTRSWCAWAATIVVPALGAGILLVAASPQAANEWVCS